MSKGKPEYHYELNQGTDEWLNIRLGIVTASEVNHILTSTGKPAKNETMRTYACQIAAEREFGYIEDHYESFDMMRGHYQESIARDIYNDKFDEVTECGFITRKIHGITLGASPDGLVGDDGGIEIKSRLSKFQVKTIISDEVPAEFYNQIQACLLVSGREWWDFIQYSNGMPMYVKRVYSDAIRQEQIIEALEAFEVAVLEMTERYRQGSKGLVKTERVEIVFDDDVIIGSED
jgi:hypothetical protein